MVKNMGRKETDKDICLIKQIVISKISLFFFFFTTVITGLVGFASGLTVAEKAFVDAQYRKKKRKNINENSLVCLQDASQFIDI